LRPFARIVRFKKPPSQFIVQRLREICDREKLTADLRVLTSLVDITSGDVRSCLNTLQVGTPLTLPANDQFIKSKSHVVSQDAIKTAAVGTKDSGTTLQTAWNSLFTPMAAKQRRKQLGIDDGRYVDRLSFMVQACGEYDRVVQGCFEHYPNLKPLDASFGNICRLHDWVSYYDRLAGRVSENMEFELMSYMPYAIVPWYTHFASPANAARPAEWPKADYEVILSSVICTDSSGLSDSSGQRRDCDGASRLRPSFPPLALLVPGRID
jgi:chromosome transmission fidelity protein 18